MPFERPLDVNGIRVVRDQEHVLSRPGVVLEADLLRRAVSVRMVETVEILCAGRFPAGTRAILTIASVLCTGKVDAMGVTDVCVCAT